MIYLEGGGTQKYIRPCKLGGEKWFVVSVELSWTTMRWYVRPADRRYLMRRVFRHRQEDSL